MNLIKMKIKIINIKKIRKKELILQLRKNPFNRYNKIKTIQKREIQNLQNNNPKLIKIQIFNRIIRKNSNFKNWKIINFLLISMKIYYKKKIILIKN